jgi:isoprenylcysteine carboxyl methyltransferase (ICMT) family protein YpbQ
VAFDYIQEQLDLAPLAYALAGYFILQVLLLVLLAAWRRRQRTPAAMLTGAFWGGVISALYFIIASVMMHIWGMAPNRESPGQNMLWWGLAGVPLGILLWYLQALGRRWGIMLFGASQLAAAEDVILQALPHPRYFGWGIINLAVIQPLGRELFMRAVLLPVVAMNLGWGWGIGATLIVELLLKLNVVWAIATLFYTGMMCALFYLSGNALCGLVAASVAGLIHALALAQHGLRRAIEQDEQDSQR